jgi:hypothetical protein
MIMEFLTGSDTASPDKALPGDVALGYIGGDDTHTWTLDQWKMQESKYLLPIWVGYPGDNPEAAAKRCLDAMHVLGIPEGTVYMLDSELLTNDEGEWVDKFADVTAYERRGCLPYASVDLVFDLPPRSGYAVADWTGKSHMYEHPFVRITQWADEETLDRDLLDANLRLWVNPYLKAPK